MATLQRPLPHWAAGANSTTTAARTARARVRDVRPMEFVLSSNWVLLPAGVKDFYEVLYKQEENLEIFYDPSVHGFRVKCLSYDEVKMAELVKETLDQLVQKEAKEGLEASTKINSLEDWRKKGCPTDGALPDKYCFPRAVAVCDIRSTWNIAESWAKKGVKARDILPESVLSKLQRLTGTKLVASCNGRTVYVGASANEGVATAKRKFDTLVRFFYVAPRDMTQIVEVFLNNEGDSPSTGEYRYLADGNDKLLRSYILDRFKWPYTSRRYPLIFQKGAIVRLNPANEPWEEDRSLSNMVQPVAKGADIGDDFGAFRQGNWRYRAKEPDPVPALLRSGSTFQSGLRPKIEGWVSALPIRNGNRQVASQLENGPVDAPHASNPAQSSNMGPCTESGSVSGILERNPTINRTTRRPMGSVISPADKSSFIVALQQLQPSAHDPFEHIWKAFQKASSKITRLDQDQGANSNPLVPLSTEAHSPQLSQSDEKESRSFHVTMKQKAGSRTVPVPRNIFPDFDLNMVIPIKESLVSLMAPLRTWPGIVDLKVELGRFCFLNLKKSHIQKPGDNNEEKHYQLENIHRELNKRHTADDQLYFTQILTTLGADANFISRLEDSNGKQMWQRPGDGRSSVYEFTCRSKTLEGGDFNFIVDIDAVNFTSKIRHFSPDKNWFAVHCTKRVWDFRLVLSVSEDLNKVCGQFAEALLRSLRVIPGRDRIPELEVGYDKSYDVEVLAVRTRNTACCLSVVKTATAGSNQAQPLKDVQRMYITEVWEMDRLSKDENDQRTRLKFSRHMSSQEQPSLPPTWYEACLKSDTISTALEENKELELGDEVSWTANELLECGAVDELVLKAAEMVEKLDGVGYWNDNHQQEVLRSVAPAPKPARGQFLEKFW
ncbi:hypothetical protein HD806DRAFT_479730 [Xylariaceae sp. AK1471]|nr:hypothetical protein HD806DRAFT_479730 [Xylariaceae sp. AK1471]